MALSGGSAPSGSAATGGGGGDSTSGCGVSVGTCDSACELDSTSGCESGLVGVRGAAYCGTSAKDVVSGGAGASGTVALTCWRHSVRTVSTKTAAIPNLTGVSVGDVGRWRREAARPRPGAIFVPPTWGAASSACNIWARRGASRLMTSTPLTYCAPTYM